jgi:nitrogen-specific signal transduction histidine kinase/ActR/RegA family two-component response regulator
MLRSAPRHDFQGQVIGVVTVFRDVTDSEKMAEERLKASKLESIGTLAGGIAHDFNNILTAILGNISLAKFFLPKDHQVIELLHKAESAGERAKDLTYQLLTFARGGAPVKRIAPVEPVVRSGTQFALHGANVSCEFQIAPDLWMVEVDERQMSQAISNLVLNAVQAMPDGGMIRVTAENKVLTGAVGEPPVGGKFVKIAVEDKGVGIPAEHLHRVFDPYFTTKTMGIGLGLATTYSIVKQHRGYIHVTSELGRGTRFDVFLPAGHMKIKPVAETVTGGEGEVAPARGTGRILVMDDEVFILELSMAMLRHLGYEPTGVFDGGQALKFYAEAMAEGRPFDLVVMDLTIAGGMGGKEAIRKLIEMDPKACAIVSSGYANDPIMADYSDYGFSGVLRKPYDLAELSRQLQKVLGAKRQA